MAASNLTRAQKAAAILVAMGKPSASRLLKFFKQEELKALIEGARLLQTIPQSDLEKIVAEFEGEFTEGAGQLDSADQMDDLLNETLSPEEMDALMGKNQPVAAADAPPPVWPELEKLLEPGRIGAFLAEEHPQTSAMILSKLAPQTAANVLLTLDKPVRSEIIKRMITISTIPEAATKIVENQLRARVLTATSVKDTSAGQTRVASVLNEMDKTQLDEVMQDLQEAGTADLDSVRAALLLRGYPAAHPEGARLAVRRAQHRTRHAMPAPGAGGSHRSRAVVDRRARSRRMIEAELGQGSDNIAMADIIKARKSVAATAIRMAREGTFELPSTQNAA